METGIKMSFETTWNNVENISKDKSFSKKGQMTGHFDIFELWDLVGKLKGQQLF